MWVKPKGTSLPESMNTYRKTLSPTSLEDISVPKNVLQIKVCFDLL